MKSVEDGNIKTREKRLEKVNYEQEKKRGENETRTE